MRGASGESFGTGIPARNREVSFAGGSPFDWVGRAAVGGAFSGAGVGLLRCHGHLIAIALFESRISVNSVAKVILAGRTLFIDRD
jgi:hypothetical protein